MPERRTRRNDLLRSALQLGSGPVFLVAACLIFPFQDPFEHTYQLLSFNLAHISLTAKLFHDFECLDALKGSPEISIS